MNKRLLVLVLITVLFTMSFYACGSRASRDTAVSWMTSLQTDSTTLELSGNWNGPLSGWGYYGMYPFGTIILIQEGQNFTGTWGDYSMEGIISGDKVTLVALYDNQVYYTFHLKSTPNGKALIGNYCDGYAESADGCDSITLQKVG